MLRRNFFVVLLSASSGFGINCQLFSACSCTGLPTSKPPWQETRETTMARRCTMVELWGHQLFLRPPVWGAPGHPNQLCVNARGPPSIQRNASLGLDCPTVCASQTQQCYKGISEPFRSFSQLHLQNWTVGGQPPWVLQAPSTRNKSTILLSRGGKHWKMDGS